MDFWIFWGSFLTTKNIVFQHFRIFNSNIDQYEVIKKEIINLSQFFHTQLNPWILGKIQYSRVNWIFMIFLSLFYKNSLHIKVFLEVYSGSEWFKCKPPKTPWDANNLNKKVTIISIKSNLLMNIEFYPIFRDSVVNENLR